MLIWANKNEVNSEIINSIVRLSSKELGYRYDDLKERSKAWELSIILRQVQRHFGERKDISILDFGAGISPFGAYLNHIGYQFVTCLDKKAGWFPKVNQEIYNREYNAHVKYVKIDISNYDGKHDVIFSASVLEHIEDKGFEAMRILSKCLKPDGLFIHAADYPRGIDFKKLIKNCIISISYKPELTPGCKEFRNPPEYTWWNEAHLTRVAFFNERKNEREK